MIFIHLIIVILLLFGVIVTYLHHYKELQGIDKKEHKLYFIYPFAELVSNKIKLNKWFGQSIHKEEMIKALYGASKKDTMQKLYWCSKISLVILTVFVINIISFLSIYVNNGSALFQEHYIQRPNQGEGSKNVDLNVTFETDGSKEESKPIDSKQVSIQVVERSYSQQEIEILFDQAYGYLKEHLSGSNPSLEEVSTNLNFLKEIPTSPVMVDWQPIDYSLIQTDGRINNQDLPPEGETTSVKSVLSLQDEEREILWDIKLIPIQYGAEQLLIEKLINKIKELSQNTQTENYQELPGNVESYRLQWKDVKSSNSMGVIIFGAILSLIIWIYSDKELEKKLKRRKSQMELDYPEIINKFTLLVNAGMTIKQAWNKIIDDYKEKSLLSTRNQRYAYEEMITTMNELKVGIPEHTAYEQFGRRTGLISYIKFSSLITQNLKKGTRGFTELLLKEAVDSFEIRKQNAKRLGEEAGTKLLIPMMILLLLVFMIIMIPAFWSFQH